MSLHKKTFLPDRQKGCCCFPLISQSPYALQDLAPSSELAVAGFHWASPSTSLDKNEYGCFIKL
jgi:hypothetical protein